jgi:hypothetical protein
MTIYNPVLDSELLATGPLTKSANFSIPWRTDPWYPELSLVTWEITFLVGPTSFSVFDYPEPQPPTATAPTKGEEFQVIADDFRNFIVPGKSHSRRPIFILRNSKAWLSGNTRPFLAISQPHALSRAFWAIFTPPASQIQGLTLVLFFQVNICIDDFVSGYPVLHVQNSSRSSWTGQLICLGWITFSWTPLIWVGVLFR